MNDHPAPQQLPEVVRVDAGGWISGPSASIEPVPAEAIEAGGFLLLDAGIQAEGTDVRYGFYWFPCGREPGVSVGRLAGPSRGEVFRQGRELPAPAKPRTSPG